MDGAFSEDLLAERYTSDLANNIGNLWFRIATMLQKYTDGKIHPYEYKPEIFIRPDKINFTGPTEFQGLDDLNLFRNVSKFMNSYDPSRALYAISVAAVLANQNIEIEKPWQLAKDETKKEKLADTLGNLAEQMAHVAVLLLPFLPETAGKILSRLKLPTKWVIKDEKEFEKPLLKVGTAVERGEALFPRLDEEKVEK